jgi:hypothetical protein
LDNGNNSHSVFYIERSISSITVILGLGMESYNGIRLITEYMRIFMHDKIRYLPK